MLCFGHTLNLSLKAAAACRPGAVVAPRHYCPASASFSARPAAMATRWTPGCSAFRSVSLAFPCIALFAECNPFAGHARTSTTTARQRHRPGASTIDRSTLLAAGPAYSSKAMHEASKATCPATSQDWTGPPIDRRRHAVQQVKARASSHHPSVRPGQRRQGGTSHRRRGVRRSWYPSPQIHSPWLSALCQGKAHHHGVRTISVRSKAIIAIRHQKMHSRCIPVQSKHGPDLSSSG